MNNVRIGIAGLGNIGSVHARQILEGKIPGLELISVFDPNPRKMEPFPQARHAASDEDLVRAGDIDAIIIATPHYYHTTLGIDALKHGLHVLVEKPISVHKADCQKLIAAHKNKKQVFAAMFNQRTDPNFVRIRNIVRSGELGKIRRINWIITSWFRSEAYYASSDWRATWSGEGGGVLLNQCPHNLDMMQWIFGMPKSVRALCRIGHYHNIEVEDDVTAIFEYANGATGVFITTTGEAPGSNRLEVTGELGKIVYENNAIQFTRNEMEMAKFSRTTKEVFGAPATWQVPVPQEGHGGQHNEVLKNFADAILHGAPLIAPAKEGIHSVELGNAILLSGLENKTVELPLNPMVYKRKLQSLIKASKFKKKTMKTVVVDFSKSFNV